MRAVKERVEKAPEQPAPRSRLGSLTARLFARVDIASLVFFRIAFGSLLLWEMLVYLSSGWVRAFYIEPTFHFTYFGFDWVRPWPGEGMVIHFALLAVLAVMIILGLWYRVAATLFFLGFAYVFLLEQAQYLNHFYLVGLLSFLMIFVPANRAFSLDARARPDVRSDTAPAWSLWLLRSQIGLVYLMGGIAKLNGDWLQGMPLEVWLLERQDFPIIGGLFAQEWLVHAFAYGALLLDLLAFPLLLWRRTRVPAFIALAVFHLMNSILFNIGIFPWLSIVASSLFFAPDWPRRLLGNRRAMTRRERKLSRRRDGPSVATSRMPSLVAQRVTIALLCAYLAVQVLVPLRHFAYPGEVSWTEEGHRFSWHMKLRDKRGTARFFVTTPSTDRTFVVDPGDHLASWQYIPMTTRPYMILQFAHYLADTFTPPGGQRPQVRAHVMTSLNFRRPQVLIDPQVDLASVEDVQPPVDWIVPLGSDLELPPPPA